MQTPQRTEGASSPNAGSFWKGWPYAAGIALLFPVLRHLLTGHVGLNLMDEGFLWYGVVQTAAGDVPLRDFQAYDPGRYYWGALGAWLFGTGIVDLRLSVALFQALGLFCGVLVARRTTQNPWVLFCIAGLLAFWMFPRHKIFESSLAMMATWFAVRLLEEPGARRYLVSGIFAGVAAVFGRNHGLYAACALLLLIVLLHWKQAQQGIVRALRLYASGIVIGYAPILILLLVMPEFSERFFESIRFVIERGNLPESIPWPWTLDFARTPGFLLGFEISISVLYLLLVSVPPLVLVLYCFSGAELRSRGQALVACASVALFYTHHALARAGPDHLAQAVHPLLLALVTLPATLPALRRQAAIAISLLLAAMVAVSAAIHPDLQHHLRPSPRLVPDDAAGETVLIPEPQRKALTDLEQIVRARIRPEEPLFIAPFDVGLYPLLGRRSPTWELYMLWSATEAQERRMHEQLTAGRVDWVLMAMTEISGHPGTYFPDSHPRIWQHLQNHFVAVEWPRGGIPFPRAPRAGDSAQHSFLPDGSFLARRAATAPAVRRQR